MATKTFTAIMRQRDVRIEDGGQAKIWEMPSDTGPLFVRIQSWSPSENHAVFDRMLGKKVRVMIDVIE